MANVAQRSMAGGEIAPSLYSRTDLSRYPISLKRMRNMFVLIQGGSSNRPGTSFVGQTKDMTKKGRLIPFIFNDDQTYALEFGELYMRVVRNGSILNVTGITVWSDATVYSIGDVVSQFGINYYCIQEHSSVLANDQPGLGTNYLDFWYALEGTIFEIPTPYLENQIETIHYDQSSDVVTLNHPSHPTQQLKRFGDVIYKRLPTPHRFIKRSPRVINGTDHGFSSRCNKHSRWKCMDTIFIQIV